jgi:AmmeMemoRadiSam system protein B
MSRHLLPFSLLLCTALAACSGGSSEEKKEKGKKAEEKFEQPGADDPLARKWVRAGEWYAGSPQKLDQQVEKMITEAGVKVEGKPYALLTPHGGIKHSGPTAAQVWGRVEVAPVLVILAPNHFPEGKRLAIWPEGPWLVPGHALATDKALAELARKHMPMLEPDREAFSHHEMEMQMPFVQHKRPDARMVLISIRDNEKRHSAGMSREEVEAMGKGLAAYLRELEATGTDFTFVMTTDLVHYLPEALALEQDTRAMSYITSYDVAGLLDYVQNEKITICGELVMAVGMTALKELGKPPMQWSTRGDNLHSSQKPDKVVGYPGGILWR